MPFALFEGFRTPQRQNLLYSQGRTAPGKIVTKAKAWESYHQFGLAGDIVAIPDGKWSWSVPQAWWDRLHELGKQHKLEPLTFEQPHLQIAGLQLADLKAGKFPDGDILWVKNLRIYANELPQLAQALGPELTPAA